jgi:hypothetical protein
MSAALVEFPYPKFEESPCLNSGYPPLVLVVYATEPTETSNQDSMSVQLVPGEEVGDGEIQNGEQLGRLLATVTNENIHAEVQWGQPVGEEEW